MNESNWRSRYLLSLMNESNPYLIQCCIARTMSQIYIISISLMNDVQSLSDALSLMNESNYDTKE